MHIIVSLIVSSCFLAAPAGGQTRIQSDTVRIAAVNGGILTAGDFAFAARVLRKQAPAPNAQQGLWKAFSGLVLGNCMDLVTIRESALKFGILTPERNDRLLSLRSKDPDAYTKAWEEVRKQTADSLAVANLAVSEVKVQAWYDSLKQTRFRLPDRLELVCVRVGRKQKRAAEEVRSALLNGVPLYWLQRKKIPFTMTVVILDEAGHRQFSKEHPQLYKTAMDLYVGRVTDWYPEKDSLCVMKCAARLPSGYVPYEQIRGNIRSFIVESHFESWLRRMRMDVEVDPIQPAWDTIFSDIARLVKK